MFRRLKVFLLFLKSMLRVNIGLIRGMWKLTKLPQPAITVFGGTRLPKDNIHWQHICTLSQKLADAGFSIITGGGPGVMEAATIGAESTNNENKREEKRRIVTMGIRLQGLQEKSKYLEESIVMPYFFTRKWLLVRYAVGFVVGPGGFGTLDEFAEVLTLIQTHHMPRTPIVLMGSDYWKPFMDWVHNRALRENLITAEDAKIIYQTDDVDQAYQVLVSRCLGCEDVGISAPSIERPKHKA